MPRANWGITSRDVENFDREAQFSPYVGPLPVNGVYRWQVKKLAFVAPTGDKLPQLRIGLALVPRSQAEKKYDGYFVTVFCPVSPKTAFRYVPFLDAIGVTGREFERGTVTDEEGDIKKIGKWRNTGETLILGMLKDNAGDQSGKYPKEIGWMGENVDTADDAGDDDEELDDYDAEEDTDDDDEYEDEDTDDDDDDF